MIVNILRLLELCQRSVNSLYLALDLASPPVVDELSTLLSDVNLFAVAAVGLAVGIDQTAFLEENPGALWAAGDLSRIAVSPAH
jgi:hypothetical protein